MEKTIEEEEVIIADECGDTLWKKCCGKQNRPTGSIMP